MTFYNNCISIGNLVDMLESQDYDLYYVPNDKPNDWNDVKDGIWRSKNMKRLGTQDELVKAMSDELNGDGRIGVERNENYYKKHPYPGEEVEYVKEVFYWEYQKLTGEAFKIKKTHDIMELLYYQFGFHSSCIMLGYWEYDKKDEDWTFKFVGNRPFQFINEADLPRIWKAIHEANKFLNRGNTNEE